MEGKPACTNRVGSQHLGFAVAAPLTRLKPPLEPQKQPLTFWHEYLVGKEGPAQSFGPRPRAPDSSAGGTETHQGLSFFFDTLESEMEVRPQINRASAFHRKRETGREEVSMVTAVIFSAVTFYREQINKRALPSPR